MKLLFIKEYEVRPGKVWPVGQFGEFTTERGTELIEQGFAKEAPGFGYDKHGNVVETREQPIKGEKRNHGTTRKTNNRRNGA